MIWYFIHVSSIGAFSDLVALTKLEAMDNQLSTIQASVFSTLPTAINNFNIHDNPPLYCDTQLCWIFDAITGGMIMIDQAVTVCNGPAPLNGRSWDTLDPQSDLYCGGLCIFITDYDGLTDLMTHKATC